MHICFLTSEYPKEGVNSGGIGTFVQFLARKLVKNAIKVSVVGLNVDYKDEITTDIGVKVYRVSKSKWKFAKFYDNTKKILKKIDAINAIDTIDIVEGSELSFAFFPNKTSYKKIIRLHGGHHFFSIELGKKPKKWRAYQEKKSFLNADAFIAVSNYVGKQTQKYLKNDFDFVTLYNSVDTENFKPNNSSIPIENSLIFIGTVCEKKGIRQLIQAIPLIKKKINNIHLTVVGRDWFFSNGNSYTEYLKTLISEDIQGNINILGPVSHSKIPDLIDTAQVCVFPSHMEAMPIAWLEALSKGKIVVASNIGPGKEAIKDKITGILVNPYDPKEIASKICDVLIQLETSKKLGINARNDVIKRFNTDFILNKNISFYKSLFNLKI